MSEPSDSYSPGEALVRSLNESGARRVLLAVSGGSDSLALLQIAAHSRDIATFVAATVDHGLRPESAEEAKWVARQCAGAGLEHVTLRWAGDKPTVALQEEARRARYRLLAGEAEARGCDALMTAHTADDQAETVFMRLARGSGARGLGGMAPASLIAAGVGAPMLLLRPLLSVPRQRLREDLIAAGKRWIDDPSNDDPRFERIRIRGLLAALEAQSLLTREALLTTSTRLRAAADRVEAADRLAFDRHEGVLHALGFVRLRASPAIPAGLVARLIRAVGAGDHSPSEPDAARALAAALATGVSTLGGAMLKASGEGLYLFREGAALMGRAGVEGLQRAAIPEGAGLLWDRRFIIRGASAGPATVEPLGRRPDALARLAALNHCPPEALAAAPDSVACDLLETQSLLAERFAGKVMRIP